MREIDLLVASRASCTGDLARSRARVLTGNRTGNNLSVCRPVLNPLSHPSQGSFLYISTSAMKFNFFTKVGHLFHRRKEEGRATFLEIPGEK